MGSVKENKWFIGIKRHEDSTFTPIVPPEGTYHADPFLFKKDGVNYVFYEDYDYDKGVISYSIVNGLELTPPKKCLVRPYHLSFPCIFEEEGEIYMIPETGRVNRIEIYKAKRFPDEWELVKTLVDNICASDVVAYKENGWWLFTTTDGDHKPVVFKSDSLLGEYNKIIHTEVQNSRPAGHVFWKDGKRYLPTQDGLESYGKNVIIKELSLPYTVKEVSRITNDWYPNLTGTHTYNFNEDYIVIDGKMKYETPLDTTL